MKFSGRAVAGVVILVATVLVVAGLPLVTAGPVAAAVGNPDPLQAPMVCGSAGVEAHGQGHFYARVLFPAGASATMTMSGHIIGGSVDIDGGLREIDAQGQPGAGASTENTGMIAADWSVPNWTRAAWTNTGPSRIMLLDLDPYQFGGSPAPDFWAKLQLVMSSDNNCADPLGPERLGCNPAERGVSKSRGTACDPVDTGSGNFHQSFEDISIGGRGPGLDLGRGYNSLTAPESQVSTVLGWDPSGPLGYGWTYSYGMRLMIDQPVSGAVTVVQEQGSTVTFTAVGSGYWAPPRVSATLSRNGDGTFTLVRGSWETFRFDATGRLTAVADHNGYATTVNYDANNHVSTVVDAAGRALTFAWQGNHIHSVSDPATPARVVTYGYNDGQNNLTDVTDVAGNSWHFGYDANHRMTTLRTPRQVVAPTPADLTNAYDASGRAYLQADELGRQTNLDYTTVTNATVVTLPQMSGADTRRFARLDEYDPVTGVRTAVTNGYGTPQAARWVFGWDGSTFALVSVVDPALRTVYQATLDSVGNPLTVTDGLARRTIRTFNGFNEVLTETVAAGSPDEVTTTSTYDTSGNLRQVSTPLVGSSPLQLRTTVYNYDPAHPGDVTSVQDPNLKTWLIGYDPIYGYRTSVTDPPSATNPLGDKTTWKVDTVGRVQNEVTPKGNLSGANPDAYRTVYGTDAFGAVTSEQDPLGHTTTRHFDPDHNVDWVQDATLNTTGYGYDAADELKLVTRADTTTLGNDYWGDGSVKAQTDGVGRSTTYAYDPLGRPETITDADGRATRFGYDAVGNLANKADPGSTCPGTGCTSYGYDSAQQLTSVTYGDGVTPNVTNVTYDGAGRRQTMVSSVGTSSWFWNSLGQLKSSATPSGGTVGYGWDLKSQLTSITYSANKTITRHFDDVGRLDTITDWNGKVTSFHSDENSNLDRTTFPTSTGNVDTVTFDTADRHMGVTYKQGAATKASVGYGRNSADLLTSMTQTGLAGNASEVYTPNTLNQLKTLTAGSSTTNYTYDGADNLTQMLDGTKMVSDPANQLCYTASTATSTASPCATTTPPPSDATVYGYDTRGNRTSVTPPSSSATPPTTMGYDQANRLTSATVPGGATGEYTPMGPTRLLDTRSPASPLAVCPGRTQNTCSNQVSTAETLQVTGQLGVPASGVDSVVLNVTAVSPSAVGHLIVYPTAAAPPNTSNLNFVAGQTIANLVVVKVDGSGRINLLSNIAVDVVVDISGWYAKSSGVNGGSFTALTPSRMMDTRSIYHIGTCTDQVNNQCNTVAAGTARTLQVTAKNGVPASGVAAVIVNVTTVFQTGAGYVTLWPAGQATPSASNMNYGTQTLSELAVVGLSADGKMNILSGVSTTDVIVDVFGWISTSTNASGADFVAQSPQRILDSRTGQGVCDGGCTGQIPAGGTKHVTIGGQGGVPTSGVKAVSVNITVLNSPGGGAMTAYANTDTRPATTTLSMLAGSAAVANAAVVTLGTDGKLAVWANSATDVIIDVNGWYTNLADTYTYTYTYGADGLRATKTGPAGVTTFTWDRSGPLPQLVAETSPAGTIRYLYGPDGTPFEQINADGTTWYLHHDQLGSTRTITDATGTTIATTTYDPYGKPTATTGTATTRLGYTGQYTDPETGLQYLRNRYYDPATASFLTRDPLNATTRSAYGYTGGNPLNHVDPSGLCSNDWYYIFESACSYTPEEKLTRQVNALNKKLEAIDTKLAQKLLLSQADKDVLGQFSKGVPLALATLNCLNWHSQTVEGCAKDLLDGLASFVLIPGYGALWSLVRNLMDFVENTFVYVGNVLNSGESAMGTSCPEGIPA